ncbi:hypothetical protein POSPLADRAFT_1044000 [Postia placenta MAD-698-R-SB12]|uniref:Uncharacterized protein n=1 Tax=Postia placenta MAD-698-R-SB12 TaxID=670580 RepID=A0A1X6NDH1_9APHY|nr:hypothetical protein POSPLADRAFT_1044000 [Postia placenta MAD-698-R-SB12]OSX66624.1 hypothetical protein POSPLADRAFT_1044000 [Postia placenta MAD-698-R-SB12]
MPAFQTLQSSGQKRKHGGHDLSDATRKRQAVESDQANEKTGGRFSSEQYWMVQWRNPQYKKHKTWDGDAVLAVNGAICTLYDMDGKVFSTGKPHGIESVRSIAEGVNFTVGNKELEIDRAVQRSEFLSGSCFGNSAASSSPGLLSTGASGKQFTPLKPKTMNGFKVPTRVPSADTKQGVQLEPINLITRGDDPLVKAQDHSQVSFWIANWRKPQQKKHKTWDGDAFVALRSEKLTLISEKGLILGTKKWDGLPLYSGYSTFIGSKEVELDNRVSETELPIISGSSNEPALDLESSDPPSPPTHSSFLLQVRKENSAEESKSGANLQKFIAPASFYGKTAPKPKPKGPLHDPSAEGAVVMKAPTKEHAAKFNKKNLPMVDVVIDPILARRLRPHQVEGVKFMYECVMGLRKHEGNGCILADEMGMGKTLQAHRALIEQNPYAGAGPVVGKILIVCPVTLINNWKNEVHKWLGKDRVGVFVGDKDKAAIKQFINSRIHQVMVIGYERLRTVIPPIGLIVCDEGHRLKSANNKTSTMFEALRTPRRIILSGTPIQNDLSEFHAMVVYFLVMTFRALIDAYYFPIQADFCNPGLLDDYNTFRRVYETPILKSRAPGCSAKETELGEARSAQLSAIARSFVLRREATILKKYLPPKHEYVVFVTPTKLQLSIFNKILTADKLDNLVRNSTAESLALINLLTKISNSPILLKATLDRAKNKGDQSGDMIKRNVVQEAIKLLPEHARVEDVSLSGKLTALAHLLRTLRKETDEKCIIVSHYTSTLNIVEAFCKKQSYTYHRLDGQTPAQKRQEYVNEFNRTPQAKRFLFLLSSKAGGVGLNLIGASRLCLIDSDWNPSHDLQSMARIHRDGQKRPVFIYRFLTTEKIYQRQVTKLGLSDSYGSSESKLDSFTRKDLRDIFTIHPDTACHTHDLLECPCEMADGQHARTEDSESRASHEEAGDTEEESEEDAPVKFVSASQINPEQINKMDRAYMKQKKAQLAALGAWTHINCLKRGAAGKVHDEVLAEMLYNPDAKKSGAADPHQSRLNNLLEAVDLENVLAASSPSFSVDEVPGGTVSFLFERGSKAAVDDEADGEAA